MTTFNRRVRVWWIFYALLLVAFFSPPLTVAIFGLMSSKALREFITLTPTRRADHQRAILDANFLYPHAVHLRGVQLLRVLQHLHSGLCISCLSRLAWQWLATTNAS